MKRQKTNPIKEGKKDASSNKEPATLSGGKNKGGNILRKKKLKFAEEKPQALLDDIKEKKELMIRKSEDESREA